MNYRIERVNNLIKEEIAQILMREMEFTGMLVTVTEVDTSKDMARAKIGISVLPNSKEKKALQILHKSTNYLAQLLDKKIHLRPMPRIRFEIDRGVENALRVEELLRKR